MNSYFLLLRTFNRNLRSILAAQALIGLGLGIFAVLLNLFLRGLGFGEGFIGRLLAMQGLLAAVSALPWGWVADRFSRKTSYCLGIAFLCLGSVLFLFARIEFSLLVAAGLTGLGNGALLVSVQPFLHEASHRRQRPVLFSVNFSLTLLMGILAGVLSGGIPSLLQWVVGLPSDSPALLRLALATAIACYFLAFIPALRIEQPARHPQPKDCPPLSSSPDLPPTAPTRSTNAIILRFIITSLFIGSGAGLIIPFFNLYFRDWVGASVSEIGTIFALGQLSTAIGGALCPWITRRFSLAGGVVLTQLLSLPFMLVMALQHQIVFCTACFMLRQAFMNMSVPMRQELLMGLVGPDRRARAAAADSGSWYFAWAVSMMYSGDLIHGFGYAPSLVICFFLYLTASVLFYRFFIQSR